MAAQGIGVPLSTQPTPADATGRSWERMRAMGSHVSESTSSVFAQQRPLSELMDRNSFSRPFSIADASSRIKTNLSFFRTNYITFVLLAIGVSLIGHPLSFIILLVLIAAWIFLYFSRTEPLVLFHRSIGDKEILVVLGIATILAIFLTKVGTTVLSAVAIAVAIILIHALFRNPDDLYLVEGEESSFLSYSEPPSSIRVGGV